ncbi:hypothetical protein N7454_001574 [Penicillium verhagenii]|nr:hypothetical protein N7454_001574 [Penicillium verhagenii]
MGGDIPENRPVEQLFLDYSIQDVLEKRGGLQPAEPWASIYLDAIRNGRFGDAIWARYHLHGDVENGIVGGSNNMTVLELIKEDALSYWESEPEEYLKALDLYSNTSMADGHTNVLEVIRSVKK